MNRTRRLWTAAVVAALVVLVVGVLVGVQRGRAPAQPALTTTADPIEGLRVVGNRIVNGAGATVSLRGFNVAGSEYACLDGWGFFDRPSPESGGITGQTVEQMARWRGANTVRVPLNEQCWLGLGVKPDLGGEDYQKAIAAFVDLLHRHGFVVVLALARSAPGAARSQLPEQVPDRDHSLQFWREVASAYKGDSSVVFDLFDQPVPFGEDSPRAWQCWRDGGCHMTSRNGGGVYSAAGMDELIGAVRSAGAPNIVVANGVMWGNALDGWLSYAPTDPLGNVVAGVENVANRQNCDDVRCYDTVLGQLAATTPVYAGAVAPDAPSAPGAPCPVTSVTATGPSAELLDWLDHHGAGYAAWSWNAWNDCHALITDDRGTPTPVWGREVQAQLAAAGGP